MKIAVYTIAKNESQFVERWFESAKEADYLLIADTGSTDGTVELANKLGINTISITINPWRFDDARNASLAALPADIDMCVALDMDEVFLPGWRTQLESTEATRVRYKYTWSWNEDGTPGLQYGGDKIHARKGYRWKHPVHEVLVSDRIPETQEWCDLEIHHYPDNSKSRGQYLPLLAQSVVEDPNDDRNAFYYARELYFYGKAEEAKAEFLRHLSLPGALWKPERAASMRYIAKLSEGEERHEWLRKAYDEAPDRREALVELAGYYYETGWSTACYQVAEMALKITEKPLEYLCEEFAWGSLPHDYAAISHFNLYKSVETREEKADHLEKAIKYGSEALQLSPNDQRLKSNLAFYLGEKHGNSL
jgi:glycosyltransferase involved in cell wall biosynthesis